MNPFESRHLYFSIFTAMCLVANSYSSLDSGLCCLEEKETPVRPIVQTIIGPPHLICGLILTGLGISAMIDNARYEGATGVYYGPISLAGKLLTGIGAGISIGGGIVSISAIRRWKHYRKSKSKHSSLFSEYPSSEMPFGIGVF